MERIHRHHIEKKYFGFDFTISELESFCHVYYPDKPVEDIKTKVRKARAAAFEGKYANRTKEDDERFIDINSWRSEFKNLFSILNINNLHNLKIINVGIGNGLEGEEIFENMPQFTGVDISNKALTYAKQRFPNINKIMNDAEDLNDVDNSSQDVYISLRTFQSTLFDIKAALNQAFRVIKPNGKIIVSISHTFKRKEDNKLIKGLLIPGSNKVDPGLPYSLSVKVWKELNALKFSNIRINQGMVENYIYGQKTK
ncbi:MAG: class I SAM-dependent methyltransferase [Deltaproteobacteria bacterium]|nr:class I SAM-dependent methyltransferase [Deltaproteobacteria bacterium]